MKKRRGMMATRTKRKPKHPTLAAAVLVLHQRVEKLEAAVKKATPRRIGFDVPDVIQGEVVPQTREDD